MTDFIVQALAGWLLADLIAGFVHWWEDRWAFNTDTLLGRWVIGPNRLHHTDPTVFLASGFFWRNSTTWIAAGLISIIWYLALGPSVVWAFATLGGFAVNEVHAYAHRSKDSPAFVRIMQEIGLFQSVRHHAGHHKAPSDRRYCTLTNWLNPILDEIGFWPALERAMTACGATLSRGEA